jgi:hypothetical protein
MGCFRVFLGAPSAKDVSEPTSDYHWHTLSSTQPVLPAATIEAATRRISLIYQNIIFKDDDEDESGEYDVTDAGGFAAHDAPSNILERGNQTTMITWDPTLPSQQRSSDRQMASPTTVNVSKSRVLHDSTFLDETQDTGCSYSDSSSIARFPQFQFSLHVVNSVASLVSMVRSARTRGRLKASVLVAVLEVDGPDMITIKRGRDVGSQVALLKMILGDDEGNVCKIAAWREVAESWGNGTRVQPAIRRGDIVLFQSLCLVNLVCSFLVNHFSFVVGWGGRCFAMLGTPNESNSELYCFAVLETSSRNLLPNDGILSSRQQAET